MGTIALQHVAKVYKGGTQAVTDLNLEVADHEFMVLVGPSGCGKTTALRMVAGLEEISSGAIRIGDRVVNELSPKDRDIAMVFQNYALYPQMTVAQNIGFPLKIRGVPAKDVDRQVDYAAELLGLTAVLKSKPARLSGGQRQRVAMGRAIVRRPSAFLMDEPLSNLDAKLRVQMRAEISAMQKRLGVASLYVTHDQTEAMTMGDRVAVLRSGVLQQCAPPQELYDRPANLFVAEFIGSPAMNLYEGWLSSEYTVRLGSQELTLPGAVRGHRPGLAAYRNRKLVVGVRPEDLALAGGDGTADTLTVVVELVESLGFEALVHFSIDATPAARVSQENDGAEAEPAASIAPRTTGVARVRGSHIPAAKEKVSLQLQPDRLHFFDCDSGAAIVG